jgi:para-aminobenzoate synthetase component 1
MNIPKQIAPAQILRWASGHTHSAVLFGSDSDASKDWDLIVGAGAKHLLECSSGAAFQALTAMQASHPKAWIFGYFGYDLKNEVEKLQSTLPDHLGFPDLLFWIPETVLMLKNGVPTVLSSAKPAETILNELRQTALQHPICPSKIALQPRIPREAYLDTLQSIRQHIVDGDVYELNFCQEFYAQPAAIDPVAVFERLYAISRPPHAAWLKADHRFALCASPERFLQHQSGRLTSQPIKGTRRRGHTPAEDEQIRLELSQSPKDRAEHVMIVDLVRNDLARSCLPGTVQVDERFGIHTFPTVHQMISTISGTLKSGVHPLEALRMAFPMGSMTGAPKVRAMELIEHYEKTRRGLYSGAIGYIAPDGNFDFNVVIRTILYNQQTRYVSASVGGAIVYDSNPMDEYEECLVKAAALRRALGDTPD